MARNIFHRAGNDIGLRHAGRYRRATASRPLRRHFLVVTEDEKSSVFYLEAFSRRLAPGIVQTAPVLHVVGKGFNTQSLVDAISEIERKETRRLRDKTASDEFSFDEIWILFDKDSFPASSFDNAIHSAESRHYHVAWSNECFELWYLLHFTDVSVPFDRNRIYVELSKFFRVSDYESLKGVKGKKVHEKMASSPSVLNAVQRARRLESDPLTSGKPCSRRNPCTLVYKLIEQLLQFVPEAPASGSNPARPH